MPKIQALDGLEERLDDAFLENPQVREEDFSSIPKKPKISEKGTVRPITLEIST